MEAKCSLNAKFPVCFKENTTDRGKESKGGERERERKGEREKEEMEEVEKRDTKIRKKRREGRKG